MFIITLAIFLHDHITIRLNGCGNPRHVNEAPTLVSCLETLKFELGTLANTNIRGVRLDFHHSATKCLIIKQFEMSPYKMIFVCHSSLMGQLCGREILVLLKKRLLIDTNQNQRLILLIYFFQVKKLNRKM